jgi:hypothetical protein
MVKRQTGIEPPSAKSLAIFFLGLETGISSTYTPSNTSIPVLFMRYIRFTEVYLQEEHRVRCLAAESISTFWK